MANIGHIGAVAIRVTPDASRFGVDLQTTLKRLEKSARIKVSPIVDKRSKARTQTEISSIGGGEAVVTVKTDKRTVSKVKSQLDSLSKFSPGRVALDKAALDKARSQISTALSTYIHPTVNTIAARTELDRLTQPIRVPVTAKLNKVGGAFKNLPRSLQRSAKRALDLTEDMAYASASSISDKMGDKLGKSLDGLRAAQKKASSAMNLGGALKREGERELSRRISKARTTFNAFSQSVQSHSPRIHRSLVTVNKPLKTVNQSVLGLFKNTKTGVASVIPAMRRLGTETGGITNLFSKTRNSGKAFKPLTGVFSRLSGAARNTNQSLRRTGHLTSSLKKPFSAVGSAANKAAGSVTKFGKTSVSAMSSLTNRTVNMTKKFTRSTVSMTRGMGNVSRSSVRLAGNMRNLSVNGLSAARSAADSATNSFRSLGGAVSRTGTGVLRAGLSIGNMIPVLDSLAGPALTGVSSAGKAATASIASMVPALSTLASVGLSGIAGGVQGLTTTVFGLVSALQGLTPALGVLPAILSGGAAGFVAMAATIKTAKEGLADYADTFKDMYDNIGRAAWATGGEQVIVTVERLIPVLSNGMQNVGAAFGTMMGKVAAQLSSPRALAAIADVLDNTAAAMEPLGDALGWVVDGFLQLARAGAPLLVNMAQYLRRLASNFSAWANEVYATGRMFEWVDTAIHTIHQLIRIVRSVIGVFTGLGRAMGVTVGGDMLQRLVDGVENINRAVNSPLFQYAMINMFEGARSAIHGLQPGLNQMAVTLALMTPLFARLMTIGTQAMGALLSGFSGLLSSGDLQQGVEQMFLSVLSLSQDLRNFIPTLAPLLANIARLMGVVLSSVGDLLPSLQPLLGVLSQLAVNAGPAVVTVMRNLGVALADPGLIGGIDALVNSVVSAVASLSALLPVLSPVVGVLLRLAGGSFSSFADGLTPVVHAFAPVISQLGNQLLPVVQQVIGQLSQALTDPRLVGGISSLGGALIDVVSIAGDLLPALAPVIGVLAQLAGVVATALAGTLMPILQAFAPIVAELAQSLIPVVQTVADALQQALTDPALVAGIQAFIDGLVSIIPVIAGLLPVIAPVIGELLNAVIIIVAALAENLAPVIEMLAPLLVSALVAIAPVIAEIIGVVAQGLMYLPKVFEFLSTVFDYVSEPIQQAWDAIKPLFDSIREYVTDLFGDVDMGEAFSSMTEKLQPLIGLLESFSSACQEIIEAVGPVLNAIFGELGEEALPTLIDGWTELFGIISESIGPLFEELAPAIEPILDTFSELYKIFMDNLIPIWDVVSDILQIAAELIGAVAAPVMDVVSAIAEGVGVMIQSLLPTIQVVLGWIRQFIEPIKEIVRHISTILIPVINFLASVFKSLQPLLKQVIDFIGRRIQNALQFLSAAFGFIASLIKGEWGEAWEYLKTALSEAFQVILDAIIGLPELLLRAFAGLFSFLWNLGYDLANDFVKGIMDTIKKAKDKVVGAVKGLFGRGDDDNARSSGGGSSDNDWLVADPGFGLPSNKPDWSNDDFANFGNPSIENRTGGTQTINIFNPVNEPSSETLRRNSAHLTGGY